ncbi:hypothetical protein AAFM48_07605 [Burkholderia pseudomallei]
MLEPWADTVLSNFLNGKGIDLRRKIVWQGTPFKVDLYASFINITATELTFGLALNLHV